MIFNKQPIGLGEDGKPIYKEDVIAFLRGEFARRQEERRALETQWNLNANFLAGNQTCYVNSNSTEVAQDSPMYEFQRTNAYNRISPLIETRIAYLKKINYSMLVRARTNELDDYQKAEVSTKILCYTQDNTGFNKKKNTAIRWNEVCGNCFWLTWWNKDKGAVVGHITSETGVEALHEGDVDYGLLSPYEVYPESIFVQGIENQRSILIQQTLTADEIYDIYGVKVKGRSVTTFNIMPKPSGYGLGAPQSVNCLTKAQRENCETVTTYFERPSRTFPKGRMIILVGDKDLIYADDLPLDQIPITQLVCKEVAGQFFGSSIIEELIPHQRALNDVYNQIHQYIDNIVTTAYQAEEGAIDIDEINDTGVEPGRVITYRRGTTGLKALTVPNLPSELFAERDRIQSAMEYTAAVSQLMVIGATPSGIQSGKAIESLRDIDNTRLALTGDYIRHSVSELAKLWLKLYKRYAKSSRVVKYTGKNALGNVLTWCSDDITSFDVRFETVNELELSEEQQRNNFLQGLQMGLFTDEQGRLTPAAKLKAISYLEGNSPIKDIDQLQQQSAQYENSLFEQGIVPPISHFDDNNIHATEHLTYMLQIKYRALQGHNPNLAQRIEAHYQTHVNALMGSTPNAAP